MMNQSTHASHLSSTGFITTGDGRKIAYCLDGPEDAPVLLFLNSIATTFHMWDSNVEDFIKEYRMLRYDMRGHGASDAPSEPYSIDRMGYDVVELLDALDIKTVFVVGLSLGGLVGQWLAIYFPERVQKLVLANTALSLPPRGPWEELIKKAKSKSAMQDFATMFIHNWFPQDMIDANSPVVSAFRQTIQNMKPAGLAGSLAVVRDTDFRRTAKLITCPTLVIGGKFDVVTRPELSVEIANTIPGSLLEWLPAVHLSNIQFPKLFAKLILDFFAKSIHGMEQLKRNQTERNKAFITEMITQKKRLEDYPGKYDEDLLIYEPASLPFGGIYEGFQSFQEFYPKVREFYDFSSFEILSVHADSNVVFVTIKTRVAKSNEPLMLCERFEFEGEKIVKVQLFLLNFKPGAVPIEFHCW